MRASIASRVTGLLFLVGMPMSPAIGQQVTLQQPAVGNTTVNTTVSVPDRGRTYLGGVNSAQSARSSFGPLRPGSAFGLSRSASSMSTSVYIHDLRAMDEALLNSVPDSGASSSSRGSSTGLGRSSNSASTASPAEKAAKFERLAEKAEASGSIGVAKLHWQMAAKYGSKSAAEKLAELSNGSGSAARETAGK